MKKDSSEHYLKYLAALSLSVATPAVAGPAMPQEDAVRRPAMERRVSHNLQELAARMELSAQGPGSPDWPENVQAGWPENVHGGWPESTDDGRIAGLTGMTRQVEASLPLSQLMEDVLKDFPAR